MAVFSNAHGRESERVSYSVTPVGKISGHVPIRIRRPPPQLTTDELFKTRQASPSRPKAKFGSCMDAPASISCASTLPPC